MPELSWLEEGRGRRQLALTVEFPRPTGASKVAGRLSEVEQVVGVRWAD